MNCLNIFAIFKIKMLSRLATFSRTSFYSSTSSLFRFTILKRFLNTVSKLTLSIKYPPCKQFQKVCFLLSISTFSPDMRVQLKKKRGKVRKANFISAKRLPNAAGGLGGAVSSSVGPGLSPGGGQGSKASGKLRIFSSIKCPRLLNFESIFTTNIMNNNSV